MADKPKGKGSKGKKPKFSKLDQRIYNAVGPYFYSTNKATIKQTAKNIVKNKTYFGEEGRQKEDPYFNEMFKYALGSGDLKDMEHFQASPYKPSVSDDSKAEYLRIKNLDRKGFIKDNQEFLKDSGTTKSNIVSSQLPVTTPGITPGHTFGNLTMSKGQDDKGKYVSVYDKWDFANKSANRFLDRKPEMYDRIYYGEGADKSFQYVDPTQPGRGNLDILPQNNKKQQMANNNNPEEFGAGGILAQAGAGAASGALAGSVVPGWGTAIGAIGGFLGGLWKGIRGNKQDKQQEELQKQQLAMQQQQQQDMLLAQQPVDPLINQPGMTQVSNEYAPTFACGGKVKKMAMGGTIETELAELESGEPFRAPDGTIGVVKTDEKFSHENGGATMPLEIGTQILGKTKDPDTKKTFKEMGKKLAMQKKKYDKILDSKAGTYSMNAAKAMNTKIDRQFTTLFQKQESLKPQQQQQGQPRQFIDGGMISMLAQNWGKGQAAKGLGSAFSNMAQSGGFNNPGNGGGGGFLSNLWQGAKGLLGNQGGLGSMLGKGLNMAGQLAPVGYNLMQGMKPAEHLNAQDFQNPQQGQALGQFNQANNLMANRRFDVDPLLDANRNAQAIGAYNARNQGGLSSGAVASNRLAGTAQRMRGDQAAYTTQQNMNNQYQGQQAQMLGQSAQFRAGLGQQQADTRFNVANINQQSDAARRQMLGAGFTGISDFAQRQQLMQGQQGADQQRLAALEGLYPMFNKWFPGANATGAQGR